MRSSGLLQGNIHTQTHTVKGRAPTAEVCKDGRARDGSELKLGLGASG